MSQSTAVVSCRPAFAIRRELQQQPGLPFADYLPAPVIHATAHRVGCFFRQRIFTPAENAYCAGNPKRYYEHLAGRFAAKEAVLKVLGTGWRGGIAWTDIEVTKEASGQPTRP